MKVVVRLAKIFLAPLGITTAGSAIDDELKGNTWFWNNNFNNFK